MPTPRDQLPPDATTLARQVQQLRREVAELRAARRLEQSAIAGGRGITLQSTPGGPTITITAAAGALDAYTVEAVALLFGTGLATELYRGYIALDTTSNVPGLLAASPDVGTGIARLLLTSGDADTGQLPAAFLAADQAGLTLSDGGLEVFITDDPSSGFTFDGAAMTPTNAGWTALPLANGWTAFGSTFQSPEYARMIDGTVMLTGQIAPGTTTAGTTVATLPFTLPGDQNYRVSCGALGASADVYVRASGAVQIQGRSGTVSWLSLSGIRFPINT